MNKGMMRTAGVLLAAVLVLSMASIGFAAEDFKHYSVGAHIMYLLPDVDSIDFPGSYVSAEDTMTGGLTLEYFFTPYLSAELVAAVTHVDLQVANNQVGSGEAWLLPPSLYVKYHPMPQWKISPYVGIGVDWIYAWDEKVCVAGTDMDLDIEDSFGWAAKAGVDIKITDNLYANFDVMYLNNQTEMNIHELGVSGQDIDIKVWSYSIGMKYRF